MKPIILFALLALSMGAFSQDKPLCVGKTKAGNTCRNHAKENSSYCGVHDQSGVYRCGADKKKGGKCQTKVKADGIRCHYHKN